MQHSGATLLVTAGIVLVILGLLAGSGALHWFGRLPGDIAVERENVRFYLPVTSMILVSIALSVVVAVVRRLLG